MGEQRGRGRGRERGREGERGMCLQPAVILLSGLYEGQLKEGPPFYGGITHLRILLWIAMATRHEVTNFKTACFMIDYLRQGATNSCDPPTESYYHYSSYCGNW